MVVVVVVGRKSIVKQSLEETSVVRKLIEGY